MRARLIVAGTLALAGCTDPTAPESGMNGLVPRNDIVDARNGGVAGFYFLPPLQTASQYPGNFDPTRSPVVDICILIGGGCQGTVARFTMATTGTGGIQISVPEELYKAEWKTESASSGNTYRVRVLDGAVELGHADVRIVKNGSGLKSLPADIRGVVGGATLPIKFRIERSSAAAPARIEIDPGTFLLPGAGATLKLEVKAFDANGLPTLPGPIVWTSTKPGVVTVSPVGTAGAVAASGSAKIIAQAGGVVSEPALALVSTVAQGAFLISDANLMTAPSTASQLVGFAIVAADEEPLIVAVDPDAPYKPGWLYKFYLTGATPAVGQIVIGQGDAPIGGRVVSLSPVAGGTEVTISLLSLSDLLPGLSIDEVFTLDHAPVTIPAAVAARYDVSRDATGRIRFQSRAAGTFGFARGLGISSTRSSLLDSETEFNIGPFACTAETSGLAITPSTLNPSFHVDPNFSLDLVYTIGGLQKLIVRGSVDAGIGVNPVFPVEVEQKLECKIKIASVNIPIGGPISLFFGGQVPVGVGFEIGAKMSFGNFGVDMSVNAGASVALGIDCTAGCAPVASLTGSATGTMTPAIPNFSTDGRNELDAGGFVYVGFAVGNPFLEALQFEAFEAKGGLIQSFELARPIAQALDPAYASSFKLSFDFEAGTGNDVEELAELLSIQLPPLKFESSSPLASSPKAQAFTISPSSVQAKTDTNEGEKAIFILTLDPVTYIGAYSVDSIELFRKKPAAAGTFILERVPGDCGMIAPLNGQSAFSCESTLPASWEGDQVIYAFVKARLFGVSLPVLLELGDDAKANINVRNSAISVTPSPVSLTPGATQQFTASVTGSSNTSVTWSATGGSINSTGLYTAGSTSGTFAVKATSVSDPNIVGTATVEIATCSGAACGVPTSVTITPNPAIASVGRTVQLSALVVGAEGSAVTWSVTGGGTIDSTGLFTAGPDEGSWYVDATSVLNPSITRRISLIVVVPVWVLERRCSGGVSASALALVGGAVDASDEDIGSGGPLGFAAHSKSGSVSAQASGGGGSVNTSGSGSVSSSIVGNDDVTLALESGSISVSGRGSVSASEPTGDPNYSPGGTGSGSGSCSIGFWIQRQGVILTLGGSLSGTNGGAGSFSLIQQIGSGGTPLDQSTAGPVNSTAVIAPGFWVLSVSASGEASIGESLSLSKSGGANISFSFQPP